MFLSKATNSFTLSAVGDILLHGRVYGGLKKKSGYDFMNQLINIEPLVGKTDITIGNLESIIAGNDIGLSSFPRFNGPKEIGYTLKELGFDLVTLANNHVLDRGAEGLIKSIANLKEIGLEYDGAFDSEEDQKRLRIKKINGLNVCFLSYTNSTNGIKIPEDKPYLVNSLKQKSLLRLTKDIREIKNQKLADVVILSLHFGSEYHLYPTSRQKEMCASLADAGADVIIGHHPHVLQPPEWIETSRGNKTFVAYSLGNFFSGQNGLYRQIGAVLSLKISKPDKNYSYIKVEDPQYRLTFVEREKKMRYVNNIFDEYMKENRFIEMEEGKFESKEVYESVKSRLRTYIPDLNVQ